MTIEEILHGESRNVEFKECLPEKSIKYMKSVVAFANGRGGRIIFGVQDDTLEIVGINKDEVFQTMDMITNAISDSCEPMIIPDITLQEVEGKTLIVVEILPGKQCPYYIKSKGMKEGTYIRSDRTTRVADDFILQDLILEGRNSSFDQLPARGEKVTEEEVFSLCKTMTKYAMRRCVSEEEKKMIRPLTKNQLISWKLLIEKDGELLPSNGFCLLAGKTLPDVMSGIQCGVFKGTTRAIFVNNQKFEGSLMEQIDLAYEFVLRMIRVGAKIDGVVRQDIYEFPISTIREMICNAICHRNFLEPSYVQVALYDDRLEVTSPGMLSRDITIERMKEGYSKIQNRGIARAFEYMKIIEGWGSGIPRMIQECREYGLRELELIDMNGAFRINMYRNTPISADQIANQTEKTDQIANQTKKTNQTAKSSSHLTKQEKEIIEILKQKSEYNQKELAKELGWTTSKVKYHMTRLVEQGVLVRKGSNRKGSWIVNKN